METPTSSIEVITLPVGDFDQALRFYVDQGGFTLDVDYSPHDAFRVVQLTPPGSSCSIQIGKGLTDAPVGSLRNIYLVVTDLEAARSRLVERGVAVSEIRHKSPTGAWDGGFEPGLDPAWRLCQLRQLLRPRWQQLGATGTRLPECTALLNTIKSARSDLARAQEMGTWPDGGR